MQWNYILLANRIKHLVLCRDFNAWFQASAFVMMRKLRMASACFQLRSSTRNAPVTQVAYHVAIDFYFTFTCCHARSRKNHSNHVHYRKKLTRFSTQLLAFLAWIQEKLQKIPRCRRVFPLAAGQRTCRPWCSRPARTVRRSPHIYIMPPIE